MAVTDNIIVGRLLGSEGLAASGIGNSLAFLLASLASGGLSVLGPMVAKKLSEGQENKIYILFRAACTVAIIYSLFLSIVGLMVYHYFDVFNQPITVKENAKSIFLIIIGSNIFMFSFLCLKQFIDGYSKPEISMYITILGLISNAFLNYGLITGYGILPELGINGAAVATLFVRLIMFLVLLIFILNSKTFKALFSENKRYLYLEEVKTIFEKAIPSGLQFFFEIAAFSTAVIMMGWISTEALAAHQIAINVASTTYMMATGIAYAGGIRVGDAWGLKNSDRVKTSGFSAYFLVFIFMTCCMLGIYIFDKELLTFYIDDQKVINAAIPLLAIAAIFQLSDGIQVVGLGVLRGLQDVKIPTAITFVAYWILALPIAYILGFHFKLGAVGIWWGLLIGLTFSAAALYIRFKIFSKKKNLERLFKS